MQRPAAEEGRVRSKEGHAAVGQAEDRAQGPGHADVRPMIQPSPIPGSPRMSAPIGSWRNNYVR